MWLLFSLNMNQLKLTGFIFFLLSLTEPSTVPPKPQDVDPVNAISKFIEENTASLATIAFAQYVQEVTFEEVEMLLRVMMEYRDRCLANKTLPECSKHANEAVQDMLCAMEGLSQRHNFSHCCSKVGFEKRLCFLYNKKANVGFLPPFPTLDPEEKCQAYKSDRKSFLNHYTYEVARRNPFVFAPVLLTVAARFEEVATACCEEQDKANCFRTKAVPITQYLTGLSSYQKNICGALLKFGLQTLKSINIAVFSKKFPKIGFKELTSLLEDVSTMYDGCCEGDVVQCIHDQSRVMNHICLKQESISSKIKECCAKGTPEREDCIINTSKEGRPADLALTEPKFTDSENVCQERDSNPDFFAEFIYEYARRHTDLSIPELLRIAKVYMDLLDDCCRRENPPDCYRLAEEKFNEATEKSLTLVQKECRCFRDLGKDRLLPHYLIKFTKTAPQLSTEELISFSTDMVTALTTCCSLSEEFACVDNLGDLVIGELCGINENRTINPAVDHCCQADFAFRRPCFEELKADTTYVPRAISQYSSAFHVDYCQARIEDIQYKKHRFLVNLVKRKPEQTEEELQSLFFNFTIAIETCCEAQKPEICFNEEVLKIDNQSQAS